MSVVSSQPWMGEAALNEADTYSTLIVPKIRVAGRENKPRSIASQRTFTDGRITDLTAEKVQKLCLCLTVRPDPGQYADIINKLNEHGVFSRPSLRIQKGLKPTP